MDFDYIKPYINPDGIRVFTGFKYHKITGTSDYKEAYNPWIAENKQKNMPKISIGTESFSSIIWAL
ncbi:hypothetical protein [Halarcobacter anaerophilus]|uniref:hypothetical protein n=1 Tax=Halarcobacter anaerophilus TaxID=877500 RepID=UPI000B037527|nr:hypothetical protein [Halarcobacter anaerophilus]